MSFDFSTLVTDRTMADVTRVKQIAERIKNGTASESDITEFNSAAMKGAYNYTDLKRVTAAMEYIKSRLEMDGYLVDGYIESGAEWSESDAPNAEQLNAYLSNVEAIRSALDVLPTTPDTPEDMDLLTWMEANDIEQILVDVENVAKAMRKIYRRANQVTFYSGYGLYFSSADVEPVLPDVYVTGNKLVIQNSTEVFDENLILSAGTVTGETLVF